MKKVICIVIIGICLSFMSFFVVGCADDNNSYLRIHIRANSNSEEDQNVKYFIKDKVVEYITPVVSSAKSKNDLENKLLAIKVDVEDYVNLLLSDAGFDYKANMKIDNEFFPTRSYDNFTLESDYYDALIINLGAGDGDNWWCVVYPPLCFTNQLSVKNVVYKSKLLEIIKKFFN